MIVLGVAGISILIIIYLYIRTEGLRRELSSAKRQLGVTQGEVKHMEEAAEHLAFEQQAMLRKGLTRVKNFGSPDSQGIKYTEALVEGLVNVTVEAARGHKNTQEAFKKHLSRHTDISQQDFNDFISAQEDRIKIEWHKKSVLGYLTVCRLMIDVLAGISTEDSN